MCRPHFLHAAQATLQQSWKFERLKKFVISLMILQEIPLLKSTDIVNILQQLTDSKKL
jgi:hypothetical protein